jgi:hypothetical protein
MSWRKVHHSSLLIHHFIRMLDSIVLYTGLILLAIGLFSLLSARWRRRGALLIGAGVIAMIVALLLPVRESRSAKRESRLDELMPVWQFQERHTIHVAAPPERVFAAIRSVRADDIALFRTLTTIRCLGRCSGESILNPSRRDPILDVATRSGFRYLADDPPRELVVGTFVAPRTAAMMNFLVTPDGRGGSIVSTETRVFAATEPMRRRFAVYWRIIHPGSDIIRRSWLQAVKQRAESG